MLTEEPIFCEDCNGLGFDPRTDKLCRACKGTGLDKPELPDLTDEQVQKLHNPLKSLNGGGVMLIDTTTISKMRAILLESIQPVVRYSHDMEKMKDQAIDLQIINARRVIEILDNLSEDE